MPLRQSTGKSACATDRLGGAGRDGDPVLPAELSAARGGVDAKQLFEAQALRFEQPHERFPRKKVGVGDFAEERQEAVNPVTRGGDDAGMSVHADDDFAAGTRDADQLGDEMRGRDNVVEDVDAEGQIELGAGKGQLLADGADESAGNASGDERAVGAHQRVEEDAAALRKDARGAGGTAADFEDARLGTGGGSEAADEVFVAGAGAVELVVDDAGLLPEAGFVALGARPAVFGDGAEAGRKILFHVRVERSDGLDCGGQCGTTAKMGW